MAQSRKKMTPIFSILLLIVHCTLSQKPPKSQSTKPSTTAEFQTADCSTPGQVPQILNEIYESCGCLINKVGEAGTLYSPSDKLGTNPDDQVKVNDLYVALSYDRNRKPRTINYFYLVQQKNPKGKCKQLPGQALTMGRKYSITWAERDGNGNRRGLVNITQNDCDNMIDKINAGSKSNYARWGAYRLPVNEQDFLVAWNQETKKFQEKTVFKSKEYNTQVFTKNIIDQLNINMETMSG